MRRYFESVSHKATDFLRHPSTVTSKSCGMSSCDHTLVELLLAHHLARPLLDESVLDYGVMVIDGSQLGPHRHAGCQQEAYFSSCWLCVPVASLLKSDSRSQREPVCLVPWTRALLQFLRRSSLHVCTVMRRLSLTDIGTGVWSQEEVALPILKRNAVVAIWNFRIGQCAGTAPLWQKHVAFCGASTNEHVQTCSLPTKTQSNTVRRLRFCMGCGICDYIAKEHRQWDRCHGPH